MIDINVKNDDYLFLHLDGNFTDVLVFPEEELALKDVVFMITPVSYRNEENSLHTIMEINAFMKSNPSIKNVVIACTMAGNFDFNEEVSMEEFFCQHYDQIEHPEKIQLRVPAFFVANEDNTLRVMYDTFPLEHCRKIDQRIEMLSKDIRESDLSAFEKLMATYILCTRFMDSNTDFEEDEALNLPTNVEEYVFGSSMHILSDNEDGYKIKCTGYTDMFARMLKKMDIEVTPMCIFNVKEGFAHTVALVDIFDWKYGVDGRYICDLRTDSDTRKIREDKARRRATDTRATAPYYGCDSLLYFCVDIDDYETLIGIDKFDTLTKYTTMPGEGEARDEVSSSRLDVSKIEQALGSVTNFRYGVSDNLDKYLEGDTIKTMLQNNEQTINWIKNSQKFIDTSRNKNELSQMLNSEKKTNTVVSTNSNGEKK